MIWFAYFVLALECLVVAIGLWMMWAMISEASRAPADPSPRVDPRVDPRVEHPEELPPAHSLVPPPEAEDRPAHFTLEELDARGYVSSRKLHMGCEAAVCRIALGARIVAGRRSLTEPQYAWDYSSVWLAEKALANAEFSTHPVEGIIGVEDFGRGPYPAAEPKEYLRRWSYTADGQIEEF